MLTWWQRWMDESCWDDGKYVSQVANTEVPTTNPMDSVSAFGCWSLITFQVSDICKEWWEHRWRVLLHTSTCNCVRGAELLQVIDQPNIAAFHTRPRVLFTMKLLRLLYGAKNSVTHIVFGWIAPESLVLPRGSCRWTDGDGEGWGSLLALNKALLRWVCEDELILNKLWPSWVSGSRACFYYSAASYYSSSGVIDHILVERSIR